MVDFDQLPYHIIVNILRHLPPVDIKNVMLLNTDCYEIINTDSTLNRSLRLSINEQKFGDNKEIAQAVLLGNRKYESIEITSGVVPKCRILYGKFITEILKAKGKYVKTFSHSGRTTVEYFLYILTFMQNIESLHTKHLLNSLIMGSQPQNSSLSRLKYLKFKLENSNRSFNVLDFCFGMVTSIESLDLNFSCSQDCQKFISQQKSLKDLTIEGNIFQADLSSICSFRLKKLHLRCKKDFDFQELFHFLQFLTSQQELQEINLHLHSKLLEFERKTLGIINKLPALKRLHFDTSNLTATMLNKNTILQSLHLLYN